MHHGKGKEKRRSPAIAEKESIIRHCVELLCSVVAMAVQMWKFWQFICLFAGVPAVLKFLKFQVSWNCPEIWICPEILLIWQKCPEIGF